MDRTGQTVARTQTPNGAELLIRYPQWEDVDAFTTYINRLASEDTFVYVTGVTFTPQQEADFLAGWFAAMTAGHAVMLAAWVDGALAGVANVKRRTIPMTRGYHVADFGISVDQAHRGQGVGRRLAQTVLDEAQRRIDGLRLITLAIFATNTVVRRLYESPSFVEYSSLPGGILHRGEYIDEIQMCLPCLPSKGQ